MKIGPLTVELPVMLAALAGYSDLAYRRICRKYGQAPYCITEMMLDRILTAGERVRRKVTLLRAGDRPLAAQIVGGEVESMAEAAKVLNTLEFDVIDLNFACPVNKALRRRRGGYMMDQPGLVLEIIRAVVAVADKPVTLKLRQKYGDDDNHDNFYRIAEGGFEAGVAAVCVHARSVDAKYHGPADWAFLAEAKAHFHDRTLIGSGDVHHPEDALRMIAQTGVDGAAAARGALGNPWFWRQVRELAAGLAPHKPSLAEQREVLLEHFDESVQLYGPEKGAKHMRKFGIKYARFHPTPKDLRIAFVDVRDAAHWRDVVDRYYLHRDPVDSAAT